MNQLGPTYSGKSLVFLKLGGSLITDKNTSRSPRLKVINRIAQEIADSLRENPQLRIVLGHGSGSFGHMSGKKHGTREGVKTSQDWLGFAEVWQDASSLNRIIMDVLQSVGIPTLAFPPSAAVISQDREITVWNLNPLQSALARGLLPVVFGDVVFDTVRGGTILSTEDLFVYLAVQLNPARILLAGQDPGVWEDYPKCTSLLKEITSADLPSLQTKIRPSEATDVTGGMEEKVKIMLQLIDQLPNLETIIFSGEDPGTIQSVLSGETIGTVLHS